MRSSGYSGKVCATRPRSMVIFWRQRLADAIDRRALALIERARGIDDGAAHIAHDPHLVDLHGAISGCHRGLHHFGKIAEVAVVEGHAHAGARRVTGACPSRISRAPSSSTPCARLPLNGAPKLPKPPPPRPAALCRAALAAAAPRAPRRTDRSAAAADPCRPHGPPRRGRTGTRTRGHCCRARASARWAHPAAWWRWRAPDSSRTWPETPSRPDPHCWRPWVRWRTRRSDR